MKKNYKSDFDIILRLRTCVGSGDEIRELGWPDYDWTARFYTSNKANAYTASCIGGVCTNCFEDKGHIHVVFDSHRLGAGLLQVEFLAELPNRIYPDGTQTEVSSQPLGIELVSGPGDCGTTAEVEALLPYIKGDKGDKLTYADLTEADKADLAPIISEPTDKVLEDIEPNIVRDALRKTPQELTEGEKAQVKRNLGISKMELFIDMWNTAAKASGRYNDTTGFFELNGITDIAYNEALGIWDFYVSSPQYANREALQNIQLKRGSYRTVFPFNIDSTTSFRLWGNEGPTIDIIAFNRIYSEDVFVSDLTMAFSRTKKVLTTLNVSQIKKDGYYAAFSDKMEYILLRAAKSNVSLVKCPKLLIECISYIVRYAANTAPITITLHPETYARVTDDIFELAVSKNITIASA